MLKKCEHKNCGCVNLESSNNVVSVSLPYIACHQGVKEFGSGIIDVIDLLKIADIPELDFEMSNDSFCHFTLDSLNALSVGGVKPTQWQRPPDISRVNEAVTYWNTQVGASMPDGIIIGEKNTGRSNFDISFDGSFSGYRLYILNIRNILDSSCPIHGQYVDEKGNKIFRNRCNVHNCNYHKISTSPFIIIDGQHRSLSLFLSDLVQKQLNVSTLLINALSQSKIGYDSEEQASIFTQVNTKREELHKLHKTWLKRFFGEWSNNANDQSILFDLLAQLGTGRGNTGSNWSPYVALHPSKSKYRIESSRATDCKEGEQLSSQLIPALSNASIRVGRSIHDILEDLLSAFIQNAAPLFGIPFDQKFYNNNRPFETFLRCVPQILDCTSQQPGFSNSYDVNDFNLIFSQLTNQLGHANWQRFSKSGELITKEFYNVFKLLWEIDANQNLPISTSWQTALGSAPMSWIDYITLPPDPIENFSDITACDPQSNVIIAGNLSPTFIRLVKDINQEIVWLAPRNVASLPALQFRFYNNLNLPSNWYTITKGIRHEQATRRTSVMLSNTEFMPHYNQAINPNWDIRVEYENCNGKSDTIIKYTK